MKDLADLIDRLVFWGVTILVSASVLLCVLLGTIGYNVYKLQQRCEGVQTPTTKTMSTQVGEYVCNTDDYGNLLDCVDRGGL